MLAWFARAFLEETDRFLAWERGQGALRRTDPAVQSPGGRQ
ncbi:hypothetical protein [Intrasporangium sp.]